MFQSGTRGMPPFHRTGIGIAQPFKHVMAPRPFQIETTPAIGLFGNGRSFTHSGFKLGREIFVTVVRRSSIAAVRSRTR